MATIRVSHHSIRWWAMPDPEQPAKWVRGIATFYEPHSGWYHGKRVRMTIVVQPCSDSWQIHMDGELIGTALTMVAGMDKVAAYCRNHTPQFHTDADDTDVDVAV